ncbi:MAG: SxtJ family membrane protein [Bacteroidota bacterium]
MKKLFTGITKRQTTEFGLLLILASLLRALYTYDRNWILTAFILALLTILIPIVFYPFGVLWFALSRVLQAISTKILMGAVFFLMVVPVGLVRKWIGADPLKIQQFKKGRASVMTNRDQVYSKKDLENTF